MTQKDRNQAIANTVIAFVLYVGIVNWVTDGNYSEPMVRLMAAWFGVIIIGLTYLISLDK